MNVREQTRRALGQRGRYAAQRVKREIASYVGWRCSRDGQRQAFLRGRPDGPADIHDLRWIADVAQFRAFCRVENDPRTLLVLIPLTRELALAPCLKAYCDQQLADVAAMHKVQIAEFFLEVEGVRYRYVDDVLWRRS